MLKLLAAVLFLQSIKISYQTGFCYDQKCWNSDTRSYFDCDQQFNRCENNECVFGSSWDSDTTWCGIDEECEHAEISGAAWCKHTGGESFIELYYAYVVGGVIGGLLFLGAIAACCCYCAGACCFARSRGSRGRVLAKPAVQPVQPVQPKPDQGHQMQVPNSPQPQYTGEAFLYQSNYPTQPAAYPPPQPTDQGYPPAAIGYPPAAAIGYPPAAPAAYPPATGPGYPPVNQGPPAPVLPAYQGAGTNDLNRT